MKAEGPVSRSHPLEFVPRLECDHHWTSRPGDEAVAAVAAVAAARRSGREEV